MKEKTVEIKIKLKCTILDFDVDKLCREASDQSRRFSEDTKDFDREPSDPESFKPEYWKDYFLRLERFYQALINDEDCLHHELMGISLCESSEYISEYLIDEDDIYLDISKKTNNPDDAVFFKKCHENGVLSENINEVMDMLDAKTESISFSIIDDGENE